MSTLLHPDRKGRHYALDNGRKIRTPNLISDTKGETPPIFPLRYGEYPHFNQE